MKWRCADIFNYRNVINSLSTFIIWLKFIGRQTCDSMSLTSFEWCNINVVRIYGFRFVVGAETSIEYKMHIFDKSSINFNWFFICCSYKYFVCFIFFIRFWLFTFLCIIDFDADHEVRKRMKNGFSHTYT